MISLTKIICTVLSKLQSEGFAACYALSFVRTVRASHGECFDNLTREHSQQLMRELTQVGTDAMYPGHWLPAHKHADSSRWITQAPPSVNDLKVEVS
jgi:hypothetical protein